MKKLSKRELMLQSVDITNSQEYLEWANRVDHARQQELITDSDVASLFHVCAEHCNVKNIPMREGDSPYSKKTVVTTIYSENKMGFTIQQGVSTMLILDNNGNEINAGRLNKLEFDIVMGLMRYAKSDIDAELNKVN